MYDLSVAKNKEGEIILLQRPLDPDDRDQEIVISLEQVEPLIQALRRISNGSR